MLAIAVVAGYANRDRIRLKIASISASSPPKAAQSSPPSKRHALPFRASAPWVLSVLPECLLQTGHSSGRDLSAVLRHLPHGAAMVRPPATLRYGDCTILLAGDEVDVKRGSDRLRVPPPARLYTANNAIALLQAQGDRYELRIYTTIAATETP